MSAWCAGCRSDVGEGQLVSEGDLRERPRAYAVDPHVLERAKFLVRAHARETGEAPEWAYHLDFVFVARPVYESVLGFWERRLCGPAILSEPELTWVL